ncbi:MAG: hypothetical protein AMDU3_IPLC00003G0018 [Thermoplasmatales archaeon I-plasma]|nr:MAG: hypothetical protein AMDU3_IPLC00003G0018 [Thermoplasmatales archaeon I-plasma]
MSKKYPTNKVMQLMLRILSVKRVVYDTSLLVACPNKHTLNMYLRNMAGSKYVEFSNTIQGRLVKMLPKGDTAVGSIPDLSVSNFTNVEFEKLLLRVPSQEGVPSYDNSLRAHLNQKGMDMWNGDYKQVKGAASGSAKESNGDGGKGAVIPPPPSESEVEWALKILGTEYFRRGQQQVFNEAKKMRSMWVQASGHHGKINVQWSNQK